MKKSTSAPKSCLDRSHVCQLKAISELAGDIAAAANVMKRLGQNSTIGSKRCHRASSLGKVITLDEKKKKQASVSRNARSNRKEPTIEKEQKGTKQQNSDRESSMELIINKLKEFQQRQMEQMEQLDQLKQQVVELKQELGKIQLVKQQVVNQVKQELGIMRLQFSDKFQKKSKLSDYIPKNKSPTRQIQYLCEPDELDEPKESDGSVESSVKRMLNALQLERKIKISQLNQYYQQKKKRIRQNRERLR